MGGRQSRRLLDFSKYQDLGPEVFSLPGMSESRFTILRESKSNQWKRERINRCHVLQHKFWSYFRSCANQSSPCKMMFFLLLLLAPWQITQGSLLITNTDDNNRGDKSIIRSHKARSQSARSGDEKTSS